MNVKVRGVFCNFCGPTYGGSLLCVYFVYITVYIYNLVGGFKDFFVFPLAWGRFYEDSHFD